MFPSFNFHFYPRCSISELQRLLQDVSRHGCTDQSPAAAITKMQLSVHCTLHTAHCTLHTVHCTLHTAHCTLHVHCMHTARCTLTIMCSELGLFLFLLIIRLKEINLNKDIYFLFNIFSQNISNTENCGGFVKFRAYFI